MSHHCDRCKREYDDGTFYNGHDYCMSCVTFIKQQEATEARREREKKEREAAEKREAAMRAHIREVEESNLRARQAQEKIMADAQRQSKKMVEERQKEQDMHQRVRDQREVDERARKAAEDSSQANILRGVMMAREGDRLRKKDEDEDDEDEKASGILAKAMVEQKWKKGTIHDYCPVCGAKKNKLEKACKACGKSYEKPSSLHLEAQKSMPVSISIGQQNIDINLIGTNPGGKPATVDLITLLMDANQHSMEIVVSPRTATIPADSKAAFRAIFDVPVNAPTGSVAFTAYLQHAEGKSNAISLLSNIKFPMDLKYKKGSAKVGGKLDNYICLSFGNLGESGGIIEKSSKIFFRAGDGMEKTVALSENVKIKGQQPDILLLFGPTAQNIQFEKLSYILVGVDSNGKPYKTKGVCDPKQEES